MHYIAGGAVLVNTIGIGPIVQCLTALTSSTQIICDTIGNIVISETVNSRDIVNLIKELDLSTDMVVLESLLKEINVEKYKSSATLNLCLHSLKECIHVIQFDLHETSERITYNNSLWLFKFSRSYRFDDLMIKLKTSKKTLENRKKLLFEILNICSTNNMNINKDSHNDNNQQFVHTEDIPTMMESSQNYSI